MKLTAHFNVSSASRFNNTCQCVSSRRPLSLKRYDIGLSGGCMHSPAKYTCRSGRSVSLFPMLMHAELLRDFAKLYVVKNVKIWLQPLLTFFGTENFAKSLFGVNLRWKETLRATAEAAHFANADTAAAVAFLCSVFYGLPLFCFKCLILFYLSSLNY